MYTKLEYHTFMMKVSIEDNKNYTDDKQIETDVKLDKIKNG